MEIDDLIIRVRATNGLKGAGIFTVRDLAERMNGQAIENHGMLGKDGWREIALALAYELNKIDTDGLREKARRLDAIVEAITERPNAKVTGATLAEDSRS